MATPEHTPRAKRGNSPFLGMGVMALGVAMLSSPRGASAQVPAANSWNSLVIQGPINPIGFPPALGLSCPDGSTPASNTETGCFPPDCVSFQDLDFGPTGTPAPIAVQKFDPSLGTLVGVKLTYGGRFRGSYCADNPSLTNCCTLSVTRAFIGQLAALTPGVNITIPDLAFGGSLTPGGIFLGTSDGTDFECIGTEVGNRGGTSCVAGDDHFTSSWDDVVPETQVDIPSTDLAVWIQSGPNPEFVDFDATAIGTITQSSCGILDVQFDTKGRVFLDAEYLYCPNTPPTCASNPTVISVMEDGFQTFDLLEHVFDDDGCIDCSTFAIVTDVAHGTLNLPLGSGLGNHPTQGGTANCTTCADYIVSYTPDPDYCGPDSFTFTVMDDEGLPMVCSVDIDVLPVNDPPICSTPGTPLTVNEDGTLLIDFNQYVFDPDTLSINPDTGLPCGNVDITIVQHPVSDFQGDVLEDQGGGIYLFKPAPDSCGLRNIKFSACDGSGDGMTACTDSCDLQIDVSPLNDPPLCLSTIPTQTVLEDSLGTEPENIVNLCDFVMDVDDTAMCTSKFGLDTDSLEILGVSCTGIGSQPNTVTVLAGCLISFTPPPNFCGVCTVDFRLRDKAGVPVDCSIRFRVMPVNDPPTCASNPPILPDFNEDEEITINLCDFVEDIDDITGCGDGIDPSTVNVTAACGPLVPLGNIEYVLDGKGNRTCVIKFTPRANRCGDCSLTFSIQDEAGASVSCSVSFTVLPVNDAPECDADGVDLGSIPEGGQITINFLDYLTDVDENGCGDDIDPNSIVPDSNCGSSANFSSAGHPPGTFTFTAPANTCGACKISFTAMDLGGLPVANPCSLPLYIDPINIAPVAVNDTAKTNEDESILVDVMANDTDADNGGADACGCPLDGTFINMTETIDIVSWDSTFIVSEPIPVFANGRWQVNVIPKPDVCNVEMIFTYRVQDTNVEGNSHCDSSNTAEVRILVSPVNDPPVAVDDSATTYVNTAVLIDLCANDSDPDELNGCGCVLDCSTIVILGGESSDCGTLTFDAIAGMWKFTPAIDFVGECCFDYRINDSDAGTGQTCDFDDGQVCITVEEEPCIPTNMRAPGSLLIYPEFDNRPGFLTIHSVTNTSKLDTIKVKLEYVDAVDCSRADRSVTLTPSDTFTFVTSAYIAEQTHGYAYMYAQCTQSGPAVVFNHLIGNLLVMDGYEAIAYGMNPIAFRGIGMDGDGETIGNGSCGFLMTDLNNDGLRGLDGMEYDPVPDEILIPRFLGQNEVRQSELIMIGLSGGVKFETTLDFLIYNDNEEVFSTQYSFKCWERTPLLNITNLFSNDYLATATANNPEEVWGDSTIESGWMRIDGRVASSSNTDILDPAFFAILVEAHGLNQMASDLPFGLCNQNNGALLSKKLSGQ